MCLYLQLPFVAVFIDRFNLMLYLSDIVILIILHLYGLLCQCVWPQMLHYKYSLWYGSGNTLSYSFYIYNIASVTIHTGTANHTFSIRLSSSSLQSLG